VWYCSVLLFLVFGFLWVSGVFVEFCMYFLFLLDSFFIYSVVMCWCAGFHGFVP